MKARQPRRRGTAAVVLTLLVASCGGQGQVIDAGAAPTQLAVSTASQAPTSDATAPASDEPTAAALDVNAGGFTGAGGSGPDAGGGQGGARTTVSVYFTRGERVEAVQRSVPRVARIGSAALEQLLGGPTAGEAAAGYATQIPAGTRLRGLTITDRIALVDLSNEFESGGGTLGLTLRLAQVTCTLDAFPTVDGVRFALDGEVVDVFSGDGLIVDEPVACDDYTRVSGNQTTDPQPDPGQDPAPEPGSDPGPT